jgi:hypothetical protein
MLSQERVKKLQTKASEGKLVTDEITETAKEYAVSVIRLDIQIRERYNSSLQRQIYLMQDELAKGREELDALNIRLQTLRALR